MYTLKDHDHSERIVSLVPNRLPQEATVVGAATNFLLWALHRDAQPGTPTVLDVGADGNRLPSPQFMYDHDDDDDEHREVDETTYDNVHDATAHQRNRQRASSDDDVDEGSSDDAVNEDIDM